MSVRACVLAGLVFAGAAPGAVVYTEATGGDLSNDQLSPTPITLPAGIGSVIATVNTATDQQDWFSVTVPAGHVLTSLVLADYDSTDAVAFIGFRQGSQFRGNYQDPASYTGYSHMGADVRYMDLLPLMADQMTNPGSIGFSIPLGEGVFTFIVQQTGAETLYVLDFEVIEVPAPPGMIVAVAACGAVATRRRR